MLHPYAAKKSFLVQIPLCFQCQLFLFEKEKGPLWKFMKTDTFSCKIASGDDVLFVRHIFLDL